MEHFKKLIAHDVNSKVKVLQGSKYLSWVHAWGEVKKLYSDTSYVVHENNEGLPYFESSLGIMVKVSVTIENETITEFLPVLNSAHKTLKTVSYTYLVKEYANKQATGKMTEKVVEAATMFDINSAIKRCLTKAIAMHGLGLYVYADEAMPEVELISSSQIHEITNLCNELKINLSDILKAWNMQKLSDLHAANFDNLIGWIREQVK